MVRKNTCIFISGYGSNLKNLINQSRDYNFPINIRLVISNNKKAYGITYAKKEFYSFFLINTKTKSYDQQILQVLKKYNISFICLAGYMKIISKNILKVYNNRIINIHPSLLPKFKGLNTFERVLKNKEKKTGCTVHHVSNKLDSGNYIIKKSFYISSEDNKQSLKLKTQRLEYRAFPEAIIKIFRQN